MLIKHFAFKISVFVVLLGFIGSPYAADLMPLNYKFNVTNMIIYDIYTYNDDQNTVNKYCKPISNAKPVQHIPIKGTIGGDEIAGRFDAAKNINTSSFCIVIKRTNYNDAITPVTYTYYGPFSVNQTCSVDYGNPGSPESAAFDLFSEDLYLRAKVGGYADGTGNIDNCIPKVNWNDAILRVSVEGVSTMHPPILEIFNANDSADCQSGRGSKIYENRLMTITSKEQAAELKNSDIHTGVYVTDGQSRNPFCIRLKGNTYFEADMYAGPYAVNWNNNCMITPLYNEDGVKGVAVSSGCTSGFAY